MNKRRSSDEVPQNGCVPELIRIARQSSLLEVTLLALMHQLAKKHGGVQQEHQDLVGILEEKYLPPGAPRGLQYQPRSFELMCQKMALVMKNARGALEALDDEAQWAKPVLARKILAACQSLPHRTGHACEQEYSLLKELVQNDEENAA